MTSRKKNSANRPGKPKFIVLTGGPGAGKTAILEMARHQLPTGGTVLPEAASVVFGGGFWRLDSATGKMAAQRAIFHVQQELESLVRDEGTWNLALCDRGTMDGLAYWPAKEATFWKALGTTREKEFAKYGAVIHLRTPSLEWGYNHQNPFRIESASEAAKIDESIKRIWRDHPHYHEIPSSLDFMEKARRCLSLLEMLYASNVR